MVTFGQINGCLKIKTCSAVLVKACNTLGVNLREGCHAAGGLTSNSGCVDMVKSCISNYKKSLSKKSISN